MSHELCDIFPYRYLSPPGPLQSRSEAPKAKAVGLTTPHQAACCPKSGKKSADLPFSQPTPYGLVPDPQANPKTAKGDLPPNRLILSSERISRHAATRSYSSIYSLFQCVDSTRAFSFPCSSLYPPYTDMGRPLIPPGC